MNTELITTPLPRQLAAIAPALRTLFTVNEKTTQGFIDFSTATIRNRNTRRPYFKAASRFSEWCRARGLDLGSLQTFHVPRPPTLRWSPYQLLIAAQTSLTNI